MLIEPAAAGVRLSGSSHDGSASATAPCASPLDAPVLVPGHLFASWLATTTGDLVQVDIEETRATCTAGRAHVTMSTLSIADAPSRLARPAPEVTVRRDLLVDALKRVSGAVGADRLQPQLSAVHLRVADGALAVSATNRFVLVRVAINGVAGRLEATPSFRELSDLVAHMDGDTVGLASVGGALHLMGAETHASLRMDASPDFKWASLDSIFSREMPLRAEVDAAALQREASAIVRLAPMATAEKRVALRLDVADGEATPSLREDVTRTSEVVGAPVEWVGDAPGAAVNAAYLLAALTCVGTDRVVAMTASRSGTPMPITFSSPDSTGIAVVQPIRD